MIESLGMADGNRREIGVEVLQTLTSDAAIDVSALGAEMGAGLAELVLDFCLGDLWTRPHLDRKVRSFIVLGALTALGDQRALRTHIKGALAHGATTEEIREVFILLSGYAGFPRATGAAELAEELLVSAPR